MGPLPLHHLVSTSPQLLCSSVFQLLVSDGLWSLSTLHRLCWPRRFRAHLVDLIRGSAVRHISREQERNAYNLDAGTEGVFEIGEDCTHLL